MREEKKRPNKDKEIKKGMFVVASDHVNFGNLTESQKRKFLTLLHPVMLEGKKRKSQKILTG